MPRFKWTGPGPTKLYECEYYSVEAPPTSCFFCKHLTDVFWDYTNGPYLFFCDVDHDVDGNCLDKTESGLIGQCREFEEATE